MLEEVKHVLPTNRIKCLPDIKLEEEVNLDALFTSEHLDALFTSMPYLLRNTYLLRLPEDYPNENGAWAKLAGAMMGLISSIGNMIRLEYYTSNSQANGMFRSCPRSSFGRAFMDDTDRLQRVSAAYNQPSLNSLLPSSGRLAVVWPSANRMISICRWA
jgi:hypothetical protein